MNPTTSAGPTANSVFVVTPPNGYTVFPGGMSQVPLYPNFQSQVHVIHGNPPGLWPSVSQQPTERTLKEGKTLGAIQILIGLVHLGLGSVMATVFIGSYTAISFYGGFPFWGGIWFIISGSLSVLAEKHSRPSCLLNSSVGFNIVSAIFSMVGLMLFIVDLIVMAPYAYPDYNPHSSTWGRHLSIMTEQGVGANAVPGVTAPGNVYLIQARNPVAPGSKAQPVGMATYLTSRVTESDAGRANLQTPRMVIQNPAGVDATQGPPTALQHPAAVASFQTLPGEIQTTDLQTLPGGPQNPPTFTPGLMYTSNQSQWNMPFESFFTFDPKKFIKEEVRTLGAIQILIGLTHIFTAINPSLYEKNSYSAVSGYLIWGGIFINVKTISGGLLPFALLEFCLTCVVSHFGCQATCWNQFVNRTEVPTVVIANPANTPTSSFNTTDDTTGHANVTTSPTNPTSPTNAAVMVPPVPSYEDVAGFAQK
ncbi:membrane-spanning 4-domains subfamily A member 18 isoform 3-T4 [Dama dama]